MKKLISLLAVSTLFALVGCGGDSDSSGGDSAKDQLAAYSTCKIVDSLVYIPVTGGCKAKNAKLNDGKTFALQCKYKYKDPKTKENFYQVEVLGEYYSGIQSVIDDIELGEGRLADLTRVYKYGCVE